MQQQQVVGQEASDLLPCFKVLVDDLHRAHHLVHSADSMHPMRNTPPPAVRQSEGRTISPSKRVLWCRVFMSACRKRIWTRRTRNVRSIR